MSAGTGGGAGTPEAGGLRELLERVPQRGRVTWIGRAAARGAPLEEVQSVRVEPGSGLAGEHHAQRGGKRQVTLIQREHLDVLTAILGRPVTPDLTRRNVVVEGVNLLALKGRRFRVGAALLEYTGPCAPCSRMEANLGPGGYQAMRGHGGICARVLDGGDVAVGDEVRVATDDEGAAVD